MVLKNWSRGTGKKKYRVELWSHGKNSKKIRTIQFGHKDYGQYKDKTPLKLYSSKDTLDKKGERRIIIVILKIIPDILPTG